MMMADVSVQETPDMIALTEEELTTMVGGYGSLIGAAFVVGYGIGTAINYGVVNPIVNHFLSKQQ